MFTIRAGGGAHKMFLCSTNGVGFENASGGGESGGLAPGTGRRKRSFILNWRRSCNNYILGSRSVCLIEIERSAIEKGLNFGEGVSRGIF